MTLSRRNLLKTMGGIAGSGILSPAIRADTDEKANARRRPNLLVFLTDDHGQWLQQAYGNTEVQTPTLASLAGRGVKLTNAFTTCPVCSPSRASFFTGRMPSQHGIHDWIDETVESYAYPWLEGQKLLSELLKAAGYYNGLVGKWHCGEDRYPHRGFDEWFTFWETQYPHAGKQNLSDNGKQIFSEGFQSDIFSKRAISFLRSHCGERAEGRMPFSLFVGYTDTHGPHIEMPADLVARYRSATFRDIPDEPFPKCHGIPLSPVSNDPIKENGKREQYYAAASSIDREVGEVLQELARLGELNNTLIVYTSDHGLNAGQHGMWEKGNGSSPQNFFEESIRVPCILSWPEGGIASGLECDLPVNHCDLFATLLDAAGISLDVTTAKQINSPGRSYLSHLRGKPAISWRRGIICEYGNARMARQDGYKLVLRYPYKGVQWPNEFYDLRADPRETTNLYPNPTPEQARVIAEMSRHIAEFFAIYTIPGHDGLQLETQPVPSSAAPWLRRQS
jgi:choline-sulfatase